MLNEKKYRRTELVENDSRETGCETRFFDDIKR